MPDLALTNLARSVGKCVEGGGGVGDAILPFMGSFYDEMANYGIDLVHDGPCLARCGTATRQNSQFRPVHAINPVGIYGVYWAESLVRPQRRSIVPRRGDG